MSIQCNKCIFDFPPPPHFLHGKHRFRHHLPLAALPMHNRVQWWLTQKWRTQTTRTNTKHRQFRRGWRSNFSPLTWCNTGPYSGKRLAARGAPQMLHTQEEEERQKCIIKKKQKTFEWRLQCSTVHNSNPFSVCGLFEIICIVFVALLYYHCRATLLWMKLGAGEQRLCLLLVVS